MKKQTGKHSTLFPHYKLLWVLILVHDISLFCHSGSIFRLLIYNQMLKLYRFNCCDFHEPEEIVLRNPMNSYFMLKNLFCPFSFFGRLVYRVRIILNLTSCDVFNCHGLNWIINTQTKFLLIFVVWRKPKASIASRLDHHVTY